jgi:AraC-like DNA-binding protein
VLEFIFIIGAFQSFFFAFFLLTKKDLANLFMGIWLVTLGLSFIESWINASELFRVYPHLSGIFSGTPLVNGPFLWLYVYYLLNPHKRWEWKHLLHFVPLVLYYLHAFTSFMLMSGGEKVELMDQMMQGIVPVSLMVWGGIKSLHGFGYMIWVLRLLNRHDSRMQERFSNPQKIRIKWLKILDLCLLAIYSLAIINWVMVVIFEVNVEFVLALCAMLLVLVGAFFALKQGKLFKPDELAQLNSFPQKETPPTNPQLQQKLLTYLEEAKPYLNPDFSLKDFADALQVHPKELSSAVNDGLQVNFFTLINQYRVNEVQRLLLDPANDHLSLLGIAFESGFNSKTTFNTTFKKFVGKTPSQYKKEKMSD